MKRKLITAMLTFTLCLPMGTTYAFSWAPMLNVVSQGNSFLAAILPVIKMISDKKLGDLGQLGSVIGEVAGTRGAVNDVFKAVISVASGGSGGDILKDILHQTITGTGAFGDLAKQNGLDVNKYINEKILGTANDSLLTKNGGFLFSMNKDGKIDVGVAIGGPSVSADGTLGKGAFEMHLDNIDKVDIGGIQAQFMSAEKARATLLSKQMNAAMERNEALIKKNAESMKKIQECMQKLEDNSKKVNDLQKALDLFTIGNCFGGSSGEAERQALLQQQKETLTEADIERLNAIISTERAKIEMNNSIMETNKQNLQIMQSAAKMQSEVDRELLARKEAEMAGVQSKSFLLALPATPVYSRSSRHEAISKIFDD